MITLKGQATEGSGPGLVRIVGSFTTNSSGTPITLRPSKGNFTVTRKAAGVYVVKYAQAGLSVVMMDAWLGYSANVIGNGSVSLSTTVPGEVNTVSDFMSSDGTHYSTDSTNSSFLILTYSAASNPTSLTLADVYNISNTSSKANLRVMFEAQIATSTMNQ